MRSSLRATLVAIAALAPFVAACSSATLDPRRKEFWLGGTVDPVDRARATQADSLKASAAARSGQYYDCMQAYATKHAPGVSLAADIASAAAAECSHLLETSMADLQHANELLLAAAHLHPTDEIEIRHRMQRDVAELRKDSAEHGRQLAIKAVVDARP